jgi:choline kinase
MLVGINHLPTEVFIIDAVKNYKKGPLYSFLSGKDFFLKEELFGLIPGDTIFHPKVFDSLSLIKIESEICYLFYYVGKKEPSVHDVILITDEDNRIIRVEFYSEIMKNKQNSTEDTNGYKILIPLLLLNAGFFLYAQIGTENKENLKTKVIEMLIPYIRTTKRFRAIEISGAKRYYVDLDTPEDFEKVRDLLS